MKHFLYRTHVKLKTGIIICLAFTSLTALAQTPVTWSKTYGGNGGDNGQCIRNTTDGGFIISGYTDSDNNGDVTGYHGGGDVWVVKLDNAGNLEWQSAYGGSGGEPYGAPCKVIQTSDGGYLVATASVSSDGDLTENHGNADLWVFKIDNDGDMEWQLSLGGNIHDKAYDLLEEPDGSFLLAGLTYNSSLNQGWLVRLSATGSLIEEKTYGGSWMEYFTSIRHTADGGYIVSGMTSSTSDPGQYWVVKLDADIEIEWETALGGTAKDIASSIIQAPDGGYVVAGVTESADGDVSANHGEKDWWVVKLNDTGAIVWEKNLGGSDVEEFGSMEALADGSGFVMVGTTQSFNGDITTNHGDSLDTWQERRDAWLVKMDYSGNIMMNQCYGGTDGDEGFSVIETPDGAIVVTGSTASEDGDVIVGGNTGTGLWIFKIGGTTGIEDLSQSLLSVYPNPVSDVVHFSEQMKTVWVYSISGQKLVSVSDAQQVNVSSLSSGTYFLQGETEGGKIMIQKIIKK